MSKIKNKRNNSTEIKFENLVTSNLDIELITDNTSLLGKPDFIIRDLKIAIFIDGAFWHGHPENKLPSTNVDFWKKKIESNIYRDKFVNRQLRKKGWSVIRFWDYDLRKKNQKKTLKRMKRIITINKKKVI